MNKQETILQPYHLIFYEGFKSGTGGSFRFKNTEKEINVLFVPNEGVTISCRFTEGCKASFRSRKGITLAKFEALTEVEEKNS